MDPTVFRCRFGEIILHKREDAESWTEAGAGEMRVSLAGE